MPQQPASERRPDPPVGRLKVQAFVPPEASGWHLSLRVGRWAFALLVYLLARLGDRLRGDRSLSTQGLRLCELFLRVGGTAVKLGQQLAVRVDFFPYEVCRELGRLMDAMPPFPRAQALAQIEASLGRPWQEVFESIEEAPLGSASVACVFRGRLKSGEAVAIKVRRPGVDLLFATDLRLIAVVTSALESLTLVRPGLFKNLRIDLSAMLMAELDLLREANAQQLFRRLAKRDRLRWVRAPKVYMALSSPAVMVSELVQGRSVLDILHAKEGGDPEELRALAEEGIDPAEVGTRILDLGYWFRYESFFFHADPHPGNFLVAPDGRLVLLDFGACGVGSSRFRAGEFELSRRLLVRDVAGAATISMVTLCPLPGVDPERLHQILKRVWWRRYVMLKAQESEWWERTTASAWLSVIEATRDLALPINLDTLQMIRATLLYDTLAIRLNPDADYIQAFEAWYRASAKRARRRMQREARAEVARGLIPAQRATDLGELAELVEKGSFFADRALKDLPRQVTASATKASYVASVLLRLLSYGTLLLLLLVLGLLARGWLLDLFPRGLGWVDMALRSLATLPEQPLVLALLFFLLYQGLIRIHRRLDEKDQAG